MASLAILCFGFGFSTCASKERALRMRSTHTLWVIYMYTCIHQSWNKVCKQKSGEEITQQPTCMLSDSPLVELVSTERT